MPDSYGTPLWMSPRLRCDRSHAAPIVTNTNPIDTTANPTTYQIAVNRSSLLPPAHPVLLGARRYPCARSGWSIPWAGRCTYWSEAFTTDRGVRPSPASHSIRPARSRRRGRACSFEWPSLLAREVATVLPNGEAARCLGIQHPHDRRARRQVRLERGGRVGLEPDEELAEAQLRQVAPLGGGPDRAEARPHRGPLERREIDVGRQVLPADRDERVVVDAVPVICPKRGSPPGRVQLAGGIAVIDDQEEAALEGTCGASYPRLNLEAYLCRLAWLQGDTLGGEALGEGRRRRRAELRGQRSLGTARAERDEPLQERAIGAALHAMDGQGVEQLVGENRAGCESLVGRFDEGRQTGGLDRAVE